MGLLPLVLGSPLLRCVNMMNDNHNQPELLAAVNEIHKAIRRAEEIADKYETHFNIYPARGMGGDYYSPGALKADLAHWENYGEAQYAIVNQHDYTTDLENGGWISSSAEC